jgi:exopolysaccharide/PEP-CTERM locus tyrosine autokinase
VGKFFEALKKSDASSVAPKPVEIADSKMDDVKHTSAITDGDSLRSVHPDLEKSSALDVVPDAAPVEISTPKPEPHVTRPAYTHHALNKNLVAHHSPQSFEAEQFRMLRTNIMFPAGGKASPRTILVTSALPGEGKSFVASNLALTIAQNIDKHVLLIDCDMRRPTVHKLFGYENVPGLSNYLTGEKTLQDLLIKTGNNHLSILPGGPIPPNPAELLSSNRMLALLREVRTRYDDRYIIIDSPPPHLTAESKALAQFVDGIVLVLKLGQTDRDLVSELVGKFQKEKILGVVANWLNRRSTVFYGSGKYSKYSYYSAGNKIEPTIT